jgi:hypothetical protein
MSVAGGRADAPKKRYIEENEQYRTRGFYVVVTMDQMQVPNLITKLSNMPWSAKIVRVHRSITTEPMFPSRPAVAIVQLVSTWLRGI